MVMSLSALSLVQVLLSGMESRTMTHGLRSIHDAILVGAGTVRQDNPRYYQYCSHSAARKEKLGVYEFINVILHDSLRKLKPQRYLVTLEPLFPTCIHMFVLILYPLSATAS